jgi:hypothetical protein
MAIGQNLPVPETKINLDRATALMVPVLEHLIPLELDQRLASLEHGACAGVLTLQRTLRLELLKAFEPHKSFQTILYRLWQVWQAAGCASGNCPLSGALAKARERLPVWALEMFFKHTAQLALPLSTSSPWPGHRLLTIDGTMLCTPRSIQNQTFFGTTRSQHGEAYYPQVLAVWICGAQQGTVLRQQCGTARQSDQRLAPYLLRDFLMSGDLLLGDGHYGHYGVLNVVSEARAFFFVRAPGNFQVDTRVIQRFGANDVQIRLLPSHKIRRHYSDLRLRGELRLRAVSFTVPAHDAENGTEEATFLTNLPGPDFTLALLEQLARMRWNHETVNNDLKTRLGLIDIASQNVNGVQREILAHLSLNNVIRLALGQARPLSASGASFFAAAQALCEANANLRAIALTPEGVWKSFHAALCDHSLVIRPNRSEPRKCRPRRTAFPMFKTPRWAWRAARKEVWPSRNRSGCAWTGCLQEHSANGGAAFE